MMTFPANQKPHSARTGAKAPATAKRGQPQEEAAAGKPGSEAPARIAHRTPARHRR